MAQRTKKAKLAHEKNKNAVVTTGTSFALQKVVELVQDASGRASAVVELDDKGTLGLVDSTYVTKDATGGLVPRQIACPATYDRVAREVSVERYQAYAQA